MNRAELFARGIVVKDAGDAQLHQLVERQVREAMTLRGLDECSIDIEDARLDQIVNCRSGILLGDLGSILRCDPLDPQGEKLLRAQIRKSSALHSCNKLRSNVEDAKRNRILNALDLKALLFQLLDVFRRN